MPTENRSNDADGWIACDDGLHLIQMDKILSITAGCSGKLMAAYPTKFVKPRPTKWHMPRLASTCGLESRRSLDRRLPRRPTPSLWPGWLVLPSGGPKSRLSSMHP